MLKRLPLEEVPVLTRPVATAIYPEGNHIMPLRAILTSMSVDEAFADVFPARGQPALLPTTDASVHDGTQLAQIHEHLAHQDLLPSHHLVDTGYVDGGLLVHSQEHYGLQLVGPTPPNSAHTDPEFTLDHFQIDWASQQVTCPALQQTSAWHTDQDRHGNDVIKVTFRSTQCQGCPWQQRCTSGSHRTLTLRPQAEHEALRNQRLWQQTPQFKEAYARRSGVEGTHAQAVRTCGLRRTPYLGLPKTHLHHVLIAVALNGLRLINWLQGIPLAKTRISPFQQVMLAA